MSNLILPLQGQVRRKEDQCTGSIWDCLPITEKAKDEIYFSGLGEEVRSHFRCILAAALFFWKKEFIRTRNKKRKRIIFNIYVLHL